MKPLEILAHRRMIELGEEHPRWLFWRGVLLAFESIDEPSAVTQEWADAVAAQLDGTK